jgi:hypothetical protein
LEFATKEDYRLAQQDSHGSLAFPTVLVFGALRDHKLVTGLRSLGYNVLQGQNREDLIDLARCHSRRIHLLLIEENVNNRSLAALLQQYRPTMGVFFVGEDDAFTDVIAPKLLSQKVRQFFEVLHDSADEGHDSTKAMKSTSLLGRSGAKVAEERATGPLRRKGAQLRAMPHEK